MKALLIIGLILLFGGITYGASKSKNNIPINKKDSNVISSSIIIGFILVLISGVLYLRK